jgi:hypothetical protein
MIEVRKERLILYSLDVIFYNKDIGVEALKFVTTQQTKPKFICGFGFGFSEPLKSQTTSYPRDLTTAL